MEQGEARRLAKRISEGTGQIFIADRVRETATGGLLRGGYTHPDQIWVVFPIGSNVISYPVGMRNREAASDPAAFEASLRETEKDIARDLRREPLKPGGMTPEQWEEIRQWPGEFHADDAEDDGHDEWCPVDCDKSHLKPERPEATRNKIDRASQ